jgi:sulfur-oxidizing protein SoxX
MRRQMTRLHSTTALVAGAVAAAILVGCATGPSDEEVSAKASAVMRSSFQERGQAKLERLAQDDTQKTCSEYTGKALPKDVAQRIEKANLASIKWPTDGKYLGDWKNGERIAQEGRGMQYSDDPKGPVGANCYACHRLSPQELSYGTIGPSLYQFGKLRGYNDEIRKYTYGKIYNAEAYSACTNMPRFGHGGILSEQQIRDVVALLMDPESPVNK